MNSILALPVYFLVLLTSRFKFPTLLISIKIFLGTKMYRKLWIFQLYTVIDRFQYEEYLLRCLLVLEATS
jgi:hypothetical protein